MRTVITLAIAIGLAGCAVDDFGTGREGRTPDSPPGEPPPGEEPVPAEMPMEMEMEVEPPEPPPEMMEPPPEMMEPPPEMMEPPPEMMEPPPAGRECVHSFGGIYDHLGCSASYQCFDGAWRMRAADAVCVCVEATGTIGCRGDGTTPDPMMEPPPDPTGMPPLMTDSESIGSTNSGRQERSMRIPAGVGYVVADTGRDAYFGTEETVYWLRAAFDQVAVEHPGAALTQVRDISIAAGGVPAGAWPHSSHRSGRDVDATYYLNSCSATSGCPLGDVALADFDAAATWTAFKRWIDAGVITYIFVDHALQRPLYEEAMRRGATATQLSRWIQYPRSADDRVGLIRHVANHRNHFHVRFTCPADDPDCIE